jgi:hypothetical protein
MTEPAELTSRALDLVAHDLRNATSALWTGVGLLPGSSAEEAAEIGADLRTPAGLVQVLADLLVEAARSGDPGGGELLEVELATVARGAATRLRRVGIELVCDDDGAELTTDPARLERLLCAVALELGVARVTCGLEAGVLVVRGGGDQPVVPARVREAGGLLADAIGSGCGAWRIDGSAPDERVFRLAARSR